MTQFNATYVLSVSSGLLAGYLVNSAEPRTNSVVKFFIVPLVVAYFTLIMLNTLAPWLSAYTRNLSKFVEDNALGQINNMGYIEVFPPLFAILIIFLILLYNGSLGN